MQSYTSALHSYASTMQATTFVPECIDWHVPVIQSLASTPSIRTNVQIPERPNPTITKAAITPIRPCVITSIRPAAIAPIRPPEEHFAKNIHLHPVIEKPIQPRRRLIAKRMSKKVGKKPLPAPLTYMDIADMILNKKCKNIIVMAGAGISTNSGIPDFRSPGTGLYDNLMQYNIPYPEAIFDIDYFTYNPGPFYTLAQELYPGKYKPNFVHYFVKLLHDKGLLLRCYTQNIDGLERMAGIPPEKLVEAHGTFSSASCHLCYTPFDAEEAREYIMTERIPRCKICSGFVKPDIVFFGEDLPQSYHKVVQDFPKADLLIVMGTSLAVDLHDMKKTLVIIQHKNGVARSCASHSLNGRI
ncbi:NAD-dependent protein deacetylase sirtuin-3-like isoform 2-T3 [Discoglossus pictus]